MNNTLALTQAMKPEEKNLENKLSHEALMLKLKKAGDLASDSDNDKLFEIHKKDEYYMKDALDKKHGYYFLRIGSDNSDQDLDLKVRMFLRGEQLETSETEEKLSIYKYPVNEVDPQNNFRLTTSCKIRPEKGKNYCDYLVPTHYHEKTQVQLVNKTQVMFQM